MKWREKRELKIIYNPEKKIDIVESMPERKGPPKRWYCYPHSAVIASDFCQLFKP